MSSFLTFTIIRINEWCKNFFWKFFDENILILGVHYHSDKRTTQKIIFNNFLGFFSWAVVTETCLCVEAIVAHPPLANGTAVKGEQSLLVCPIIRACMVTLPEQLSRSLLRFRDEELRLKRRMISIRDFLNRTAAWVAEEGKFEFFKCWAILIFFGYGFKHSSASFQKFVFCFCVLII